PCRSSRHHASSGGRAAGQAVPGRRMIRRYPFAIRDMTQADFLKSPFPAPRQIPEGTPEGPSRFFNREISWLAFNWRVLDEARNPRVPLLERLRFLSISATNLDEFYTVRVAGLRELVREGNVTPSDDGLTPAEQLALINADARRLMGAQQTVWNKLRREMEAEGIVILSRSRVTRAEAAFLRTHFLEQVFPVLTPLTIDPAHPFPFIPNAGFCLALELARESDGSQMQALLPMYLPRLCPGYRDVGHCAFRVLRDSDLELEDEAEDLVREFETALKRRRRGDVIRLKITAGAPDRLRKLIMQRLQVGLDEVIQVEGLLGMADMRELVLDSRPDLQWPSFVPRVPERVQDHDGDMFAAIRQKDMLLHHPYETFDIVVRFLQQAAGDHAVVA